LLLLLSSLSLLFYSLGIRSDSSYTLLHHTGTVTAQACPALNLPQDIAATVLDLLYRILQSSMQRRAVFHARVKCHEMDEDELEMLREDMSVDEDLQYQVTDAVGVVCRVFGARALPCLEKSFVNQIQMMCDPRCTTGDRRYGIFMLDDIFEHAVRFASDDMAQRYYKTLFPCILSCLNVPIRYDAEGDLNPPDIPGLIQAAAYGVGVAARFGRKYFQHVETEVINRFVALLRNGKLNQLPSMRVCLDNVVASMGHILEFGNHDAKELWDIWMSRLPLSADLEESRNVLQLLLRLLAKNDKRVLGRLDQVLSVFLNALSVPELCNDGKEQKLRDALMSTIRQIRSKIPQNVVSNIISSLSPNARRAFSVI